MRLHFSKIGNGAPFIILHGLYGNGDNWFSIARKLENDFTVFLLDQRNHGRSEHSELMNYRVMAEDLREFILENNLEKVNLLGHSMGGKVAMSYASVYPETVKKLVVVDISPKSYVRDGKMAMQARFHESTIMFLQELDLANTKSRRDLDSQLAKNIQNPAIRQFLLKNVKRNNDESFFWQINLRALSENLEKLFVEVEKPKHTPLNEFPALFIKGENSGYLNNSDPEIIADYYADSRIITLKNTGHWVHAEEPEKFVEILNSFLKN